MPQVNPALEAMARIRAGESYEAVMADVTKASTQAAEAKTADVDADGVVSTGSGPAPHAAPLENVVGKDGKLNQNAFSVDGDTEVTPVVQPTAVVEDADDDDAIAAVVTAPKPKGKKPTAEDFADLQSKLAVLTAQLSSLQSPKAAAAAVTTAVEALADEGVDPEDIEAFGEEGAKALAKFLKKRGLTKANIEAATKSVDGKVADIEEKTFSQTVKSSISEFESIVKSQEWLDYVQEEIPLAGKPIGYFLNEAHNSRDLAKIVSIFKEFARRKDAKPGKTLKDIATPKANQQTTTGVTGGSKPVLALSKLHRAMNDFNRGVIPREKMLEIKDMYSEAEAEGRVDMTK